MSFHARLPVLGLIASTLMLAACDRGTPPEPLAPPDNPEPVSAPAGTAAATNPAAGGDAAAATPATAGSDVAAPADPLAAALAGAHRSAENRARDEWRHPRETLTFFGVTPTQTIIEVTPGGGWYTEVLAPMVRGQGKLVAAIIDPASVANEGGRGYYERSNGAFEDKLKTTPDVYGEVEVRRFDITAPSFGPAGSADTVVTFRNVHNWLGSGSAEGMFKGFFDVLKPGGVLGVVEHRARPDSTGAKNPESGYMTEDAVIALATAAGFELAERSEINANPKDTADHPNGVWTLPPSLNVPDGEDAQKYRAIGESDRMTLKFVKPRGDEIQRQGMDTPAGNG
jgi:predicted methyltransferase